MHQRNFGWKGHPVLLEAGHLVGCFSWDHRVWRPDFVQEEIRGGGCGVSF